MRGFIKVPILVFLAFGRFLIPCAFVNNKLNKNTYYISLIEVIKLLFIYPLD